LEDISRPLISKYSFNKVSRSFGDIDAKIIDLGGKPNVLSAIPDIYSFKIKATTDFIIMGCNLFLTTGDGIYDKLTNSDILECFWSSFHPEVFVSDSHEQSAKVVDLIIKSSMINHTLDNVTCIFISFENFVKTMNAKNNPDFDNKIQNKLAKLINTDFYQMKPVITDNHMLIDDEPKKQPSKDYSIQNNTINIKKPPFKINTKIAITENHNLTKNDSLPNIYKDNLIKKKI
jgi:hypothetical protein